MTSLILATRNWHKVHEIQQILGADFGYFTLEDFPDAPEVVEDGETFAANASKKSLTLARWITGDEIRWSQVMVGPEKALVMADDSGLEVDALNGAPGVRSARFAADDANGNSGNSADSANNEKLLELLQGVPPERRTARFRCVIALAPARSGKLPTADDVLFAEGVCEGRIGSECRGEAGFGYDPLFTPDSYKQTFAELGAVEKNKISHRSKALRAALDVIKTSYH